MNTPPVEDPTAAELARGFSPARPRPRHRQTRRQYAGSCGQQVLFAFLQSPRRIGQALIEVGRLKIRIGRQDPLARLARSQQPHNGPDCYAQAANARLAAHDRRAMGDSSELHGILQSTTPATRPSNHSIIARSPLRGNSETPPDFEPIMSWRSWRFSVHAEGKSLGGIGHLSCNGAWHGFSSRTLDSGCSL